MKPAPCSTSRIPESQRSILDRIPGHRAPFILSGAIAAAITLALSAQTMAETFIYTPTTTPGDLWSVSTNWSATPVSGADTTLTFSEFNSTEVADGLANTTIHDLAGGFFLNVLNLQGTGPILEGGVIHLNSAAPGTGLNFVSNGTTTPVVNLNANNGISSLAYHVNAPIALSNHTLFTGNGTATFDFASGIQGAGVTLSKSGTSTLTLGGNSMLGSLAVGNQSHGGKVIVASGGSLSVGSGSTDSVLIGGSLNSNGNTFSGTLDVSAAASFTANVGTFYVSYTGGGSPPVPLSGTLHLGVSNDIEASGSFRVGHSENQPATAGGVATTAASGYTAIRTPTMMVGTGKSSGSFTVGSGATLNISGNTATPRAALTIGSNTIGTGSSFVGTLDASDAVFTAMLSNLIIGNDGNNNSGSVTGSLLLSDSESNYLDVSGGTGSGGVVVIGRHTAGSGIGTGTLTIGNLQEGSQIVATNNSTAILIGQAAAAGKAVGTLNLNGGTLKITTTGTAIAGGNNGTSTVNFNGTTLRAGASSANWITGLTTANIAEGGAHFDTSGFKVATGQNFTGTGSLTKTGAGMLTLSGVNTYEGRTLVQEGILFLTKTDALSGYGVPGRLSIADGAGLGVNVGGAGEFTLAELETYRTNGTFAGTVHQLAIGTGNAGSDLTYSSSLTKVASFAKLGANKLTLSNTTVVEGGLEVGVNNAGGTLAVGSGPFAIGTVTGGDLNIGVTNIGTAASGILDLTAASSFTANLTNITVGAARNDNVTGQGTLLLPSNSTIQAFNSFVIGKSEGAFNNVVSSVTTGTGGLTTIETGTMTIGGSKSRGTFTLGSGSTLELSGPFGDRAALLIGRGDVFGGSGNWYGTADMSAGVFKATLKQLVLGYNESGSSTYTEAGTLILSDSADNHLDILGSGNTVTIGRWISGGDSTTEGLIAAVGTLTLGNLDETSSIVSTDNGTAILLGTGGAEGKLRASGTLNLNGGTLAITTEGAAISGDTLNTSNLSTVNFNGTTLKAGASSASWIQGLSHANVGAGGAKFDTDEFDIVIPQALAHAEALGAVADGGLTKSGTGTLELSGANAYTGTTTINEGALLISGNLSGTNAVVVNGADAKVQFGANDVLNDLAGVTLKGGALETLGFSDTVGALTLAASSVIDLGDAASILRFSDSSGIAWSGTLGILNWSGLTAGGGNDQLFFGNASNGLTNDQLALMVFINPAGFEPGSYNAAILPTGEIVAVPEPGSLALLVGAAGLLGFRRRR